MLNESIRKAINDGTVRGAYFGLSAYGGWYANSFDGKTNFQTRTLKELKAKAKETEIYLAIRNDH